MTPEASRRKSELFGSPVALVAVVLGGALGTFFRVVILQLTATTRPRFTSIFVSPNWLVEPFQENWTDFIPWWLIVINTVGVFVAAWLLAGPIAHRKFDDPFRLFVITGVLGGLTSYSSLVASVAQINRSSLVGASAVMIAALILGLLAAALGVKVARR